MRRTFLVLPLVAAALLIGPTARAEYKKTKVAVIDFQLHGEGYETQDMGKFVAEWLITALVRDGRFEVIERRLLEKILAEQQLGISGIMDESSASKLGQMLGAKVVISGSVMSLKGQIEVNARIIDVQTGSVIAAENVKSRSAEALEDLVIQMAQAIIRDFPLEGYVVRRSGRDVIIDLGKTSGIRPGMRFLVFKEGEVIKHPKTGEVLDVLMKETGRIEIVHVMDKTSDALLISETGEIPVDYGHMVKSVTAADGSAPQSPLPQPLRQTRQQQAPQPPPKEPKPAKQPRQAKEPPPQQKAAGDLGRRLAALQARVPQLRALWLEREQNKDAWKGLFKEMRDEEVRIYRENKKDPEVFVLLARMYHAVEDSRAAIGYTQNAIGLNDRQPSLWALRGDIILETIKRLEPQQRLRHKQAPEAVKAYRESIARSGDLNFKANCAYLIGEIYADILQDEKTARKFWQQAAADAPGSEGAQKAMNRLR